MCVVGTVRPCGKEAVPLSISLESKVAIVTGAASGIGETTAHTLALAGASVVAADINAKGAEEVAAAIRESGGTAVAQGVDLEREDDIRDLVTRAVDEFGGLDVLDNNAALTEPSHFARDVDIVGMEAEVWDRVFAVNVRGSMLACKYALPHLLRRGGGSIINIMSVSGLRGDATNSAYGTSKAALVGLTMYVAAQHLKDSVRCNAVAPGLTLTPAARGVVPAVVTDMFERQQSRLGEPADIANVVAFLASDLSAMVTGQVIPTDGGGIMHVPMLLERMALVRGETG